MNDPRILVEDPFRITTRAESRGNRAESRRPRTGRYGGGSCDRKRWSAILLTLLLTLSTAAHAEDAETPSSEELLREMAATLKDARTLRFHAEITFDDVLISGQKLQYTGAADVVVRRPDGIYVDYRDDFSAKRFWYDGKTGTLLDVFLSKYSTAELPGDLDAAVAQLEERYSLTLPMGNLIASNLFEVIDAKARAWAYLGIRDVEGVPAHHIAILGDDADLQIWIQSDGEPLPVKFVVTYKTVPQAPQYQAVLMDWKIDTKVSDKTFLAELPKDAGVIEFLVVEDQ